MRFVRAGIERGDLEQVAHVGLLKAYDRFDPASGTPFEGFAWTAILGELLHYVRDFEHLVRLPRRVRESIRSYQLANDRLLLRLEREPTDAEIAFETNLSIHEVRETRRAAGSQPASITQMIEGRTGGQTSSLHWEDRAALREALATLPSREQHIIVGAYFYGFSTNELSEGLTLSPRHVARLRCAALKRLARSYAPAYSA